MAVDYSQYKIYVDLPGSSGYAGWCGMEKRLWCGYAGDSLCGSAYHDHLLDIPETVRGRCHGWSSKGIM